MLPMMMNMFKGGGGGAAQPTGQTQSGAPMAGMPAGMGMGGQDGSFNLIMGLLQNMMANKGGQGSLDEMGGMAISPKAYSDASSVRVNARLGYTSAGPTAMLIKLLIPNLQSGALFARP